MGVMTHTGLLRTPEMFVTREPKASYSETSRVRINLKQMSIFIDGSFKIPVVLKKVVLTIYLTSSSNPECKVYIGDQLGVEVSWKLFEN